jgi:hypothetical protein
MTEIQKKIKQSILEASNRLNNKTYRGHADLILVSNRVHNHIQPLLDGAILDGKFIIVSPSDWDPSPCDVRAMYFPGFLKVEQTGNKNAVGEIEISELEASVVDEELPSKEFSITLDNLFT